MWKDLKYSLTLMGTLIHRHWLGKKNRLTHRKIAAKTANLQGIIWYSQELTERVLETLAMQKTERAVDIQPRKCHWY